MEKLIRRTFYFCFLLLSYGGYAQEGKIITGKITFTDGTSLPGVNIIQKGTSNGVISDFDGNYRIQLVEGPDVLVFSFIGFAPKEEVIEGRNKIDVSLAEDRSQLEEVVLIGYGEVSKEDLTGSVQVITSDVFSEQVSPTLDDALKGRLAGVQISSNDGAPGGSSRIRIRGTNTITGSGEPLYVIDGVPLNSSNYGTGDSGETENSPMAFLNPGDIKSVEVLKDASATAIYGSRGSNGVILIKTKDGSNEKMTISLNSKYGLSEIEKQYHMMNTQEYAYFRHYRQYGEERWKDWESYADSTNTNWQDELGQIGRVRDLNLSIRGSDLNTTYSANLGLFDQKGVIISSDFSRATGRINFTQKLSEKLKLTSNISYAETSTNGVFAGIVGTGLISWNMRYPPYIDPFDTMGEFNFNEENEENLPVNPLVNARDTKKLDQRKRFFGKWGLDYKMGKYFSLNSSFALDNDNRSLEVFLPVTSRGRNFNGRARKNETYVGHWVQDNILTFNKMFGKGHSVNAIIGTSLEKNVVKIFSAEAFDFPIPFLNIDYLESASKGSIPRTMIDESTLASLITRVNYNYKQKYYLTGSFRADGSSHFGVNHKWGYFPSGAFKWRLKKENFLKNFDPISNLALRLSFGATGNQSIPPYQTLAASNSSRTYFNNQGYLSLVTTRNANPDLKWETTYQYNGGIDFSFLNDRLELSVDAYYKKTINMLLSKPTPRYTGFTSKLENIGSMENKGIEVVLNSFNIDKAFKWDTQFNIAFNQNKVLNLGGPDELILNPRFDINTRDELILEVGKPIGQWYGYVADGIFSSWEEIQESGITRSLGIPYVEDSDGNPVFKETNLSPGMIRFKDISGPDGAPDGIVDTYDRTVIGNGLPDFTGSITNNFSYKNISFRITFNYSYGAENLNANLINTSNFSQLDNKLAEATDFFIIENPGNNETRSFGNLDAKYPSPFFPFQFGNNSNYISDASFLRLSNLTIGYNFSEGFIRRMRIKNAKLYLTGNNLYLWTKYNGYDPEVTTGQAFETGGSSKNLAPGLDHGAYPASRSVSLGLNITI